MTHWWCKLKIATAMVRQILVDIGSSMDVIMLECFKKLQYTEKDLEAAGMPLIGFGGHTTYALGIKKLPVRVGDKDNSKTVDVNFLVVAMSFLGARLSMQLRQS